MCIRDRLSLVLLLISAIYMATIGYKLLPDAPRNADSDSVSSAKSNDFSGIPRWKTNLSLCQMCIRERRATDPGGDLRKGQELHALRRGEHRNVSGSAHVGGAQPGCNGGLDGVEAHQLPADPCAQGHTAHHDQHQDQVGDGECRRNRLSLIHICAAGSHTGTA